jgi:hypothetical protein
MAFIWPGSTNEEPSVNEAPKESVDSYFTEISPRATQRIMKKLGNLFCLGG